MPPTAVAHETNDCGDGQNLSTSSLSSALAKNVAKIIGETQDVRKLNKYRKKLRNSPNSKVLQQDYKIHLAHVQTKVLGKHSQVAKRFNEWEKQFTSTNIYRSIDIFCSRSFISFKPDVSHAEFELQVDRFFSRQIEMRILKWTHGHQCKLSYFTSIKWTWFCFL